MKLTGIIPALITPLDDKNALIEKGVRQLVRRHIADAADGIYVCGSTGESMVLEKNVRKRMCEICIEEGKGKLPVIIHIGANNLETGIELARHAEKAGADAIASVPPGYFKYDRNDVYNYYKEIAKAVDIPVILYYVPLGGALLDAELVRDIYNDMDNVTALKWSSRDYYDLLKVKEYTNGEINILNGPDETLICGLAAGADGAVGSSYNILLKTAKAIFCAYQSGDVKTANDLQIHMNRFIALLLDTGAFLSAMKYILSLQMIEAGDSTYPLKRIGDSEKQLLKRNLMELGFEY